MYTGQPDHERVINVPSDVDFCPAGSTKNFVLDETRMFLQLCFSPKEAPNFYCNKKGYWGSHWGTGDDTAVEQGAKQGQFYGVVWAAKELKEKK